MPTVPTIIRAKPETVPSLTTTSFVQPGSPLKDQLSLFLVDQMSRSKPRPTRKTSHHDCTAPDEGLNKVGNTRRLERVAWIIYCSYRLKKIVQQSIAM